MKVCYPVVRVKWIYMKWYGWYTLT